MDNSYYRWLASSYHLRREPALVLYYTFDCAMEKPDRVLNLAGATAGKLDGLVGNGQDSETCPQWVTAGRWPEQRALYFDGSRQQQVRIPHSNELNITQALTITGLDSAQYGAAGVHRDDCLQANGSNGGAGLRDRLGLLRQSDPHGGVRCSLYFQSGGRRVTSPGTIVVPGQWMHVAVVANGPPAHCTSTATL